MGLNGPALLERFLDALKNDLPKLGSWLPGPTELGFEFWGHAPLPTHVFETPSEVRVREIRLYDRKGAVEWIVEAGWSREPDGRLPNVGERVRREGLVLEEARR
jgi:hypothetical protein